MPTYKKQCPYCGTGNPLDSARCIECGKLIRRFASSIRETSGTIPLETPGEEPPSAVDESTPARAKYQMEVTSLSPLHKIELEGPVVYEVEPVLSKPDLLYLAGITAAELITALVSPLGGIIFHISILLGLVYHASIAGGSRQKLYLTLALAPLIRLISMSMPLTNFPQIYWYAIIAVPLLLATFGIIRRLNFSLPDIGFTLNRIPLQVLVVFAGIPFGIVEFYILRPDSLISELSWQAALVPGLILMIGTGFTEEVVFRGVMQRSAVEAIGEWGWVYVAGVFAALHIGYLSVLDVAFVFVIGLFFGWIVKKTGSILGVSLSHGLANITLYLVMPFLV
ncbi:type II CAAX prenyl endopeptidase Rce1 family protein [Chloroflexota bacterium]